jgi:hypothetical protein
MQQKIITKEIDTSYATAENADCFCGYNVGRKPRQGK